MTAVEAAAAPPVNLYGCGIKYGGLRSAVADINARLVPCFAGQSKAIASHKSALQNELRMSTQEESKQKVCGDRHCSWLTLH